LKLETRLWRGGAANYGKKIIQTRLTRRERTPERLHGKRKSVDHSVICPPFRPHAGR
jgi:hypothetical protein